MQNLKVVEDKNIGPLMTEMTAASIAQGVRFERKLPVLRKWALLVEERM